MPPISMRCNRPALRRAILCGKQCKIMELRHGRAQLGYDCVDFEQCSLGWGMLGLRHQLSKWSQDYSHQIQRTPSLH